MTAPLEVLLATVRVVVVAAVPALVPLLDVTRK